MALPLSRRAVLKSMAAGCVAATLPVLLPGEADARNTPAGWVVGHLTGTAPWSKPCIAEGTQCVFGIPGAQENELWDEMKSRDLPLPARHA